MAGISTPAYRLLARRFGAAMVYSEMVSCNSIVYNPMKAINLIRFSQAERPIGIQLFGADPELMHQAARFVSDQEPDLIDLNFGCPVHKVVRKNGGAAVLKDLGLVRELVAAVVSGSDQPVTAKLRSGWDELNKNFLTVGQIARDAGAAAVTLHARTRSSLFTGKSDWSHIRQLKEALDIPVIGNGDITSGPDAVRMMTETGCDAVMIGRAARGNPWIFREINNYLETGREGPGPTLIERCQLILEHARLLQKCTDPDHAILKMRGIAIRYIKAWPKASDLRRLMTGISSYENLEEILSEYLRQGHNLPGDLPNDTNLAHENPS